MQEMGLSALGLKPNTSHPNRDHTVYPYLLRNLSSGWPDHIWGIDITYIRLPHGWLYLVAVLDWFSRYVLTWELDQTLEMLFVLTAVDRALVRSTPTIWNSDQGSHFTSSQFYEFAVFGAPASPWRSDQHGRQRPCSGQHFHGTPVANGEVRRGLSA